MNLQDIIPIVTALVALMSAIAAVTPTPKKGSLLCKLYKLVDLIALNVGHAKEKDTDTE